MKKERKQSMTAFDLFAGPFQLNCLLRKKNKRLQKQSQSLFQHTDGETIPVL